MLAKKTLNWSKAVEKPMNKFLLIITITSNFELNTRIIAQLNLKDALRHIVLRGTKLVNTCL